MRCTHLLASVVLLFAVSCTKSSTQTATLGVALSSSSHAQHDSLLAEAHATIDRVTVHSSGQWAVVRDGINADVDVLRLADSAVELGFGDLPPGKITQIRLHVASSPAPHVVLTDGSELPLKVPSGSQSGIKIIGHWQAEQCESVHVGVDLNGPLSVRAHAVGHRDLWMLRPVIKAKADVSAMDDCVPGDDDGDDGDVDDDDGDHGGGDMDCDDDHEHEDHDMDVDDDHDCHGDHDPNAPAGMSGTDHGKSGRDDSMDSDDDDDHDDMDVDNDDDDLMCPPPMDNPMGDPMSDPMDPNDPNGNPADPTGNPTGNPTGSPCTTDGECGLGAYCNEVGVCVAL